MVAAATTSLPEHIDAGRNYDYRYVWIRDQCYAGQAAAAADVDSTLDSAVRFVTQRLVDDGPDLKPAYTVSGMRCITLRRRPRGRMIRFSRPGFANRTTVFDIWQRLRKALGLRIVGRTGEVMEIKHGLD